MSNDHTSVGDVRRDLAQPADNVLVGKSMKSVSPDTLTIKAFRNSIVIRDSAVRAMERRVEAGDLTQFRSIGKQRSNRCEVIRLMEGRESVVSLQPHEHVTVDDNRFIVFRTTMNDAMADRDQLHRLRFSQPIGRGGNRSGNIGDFARCVRSVNKRRSIARLGAQPRLSANSIHLAFDQPRWISIFWKPKYLEFDA